MNFSLNGKVAVITGSARGIGKEIALGLGRLGAKVIISDVDLSTLSGTEKEFKESKIDCFSVTCDVSDHNNVRDAVLKIEKEFSKIDILVNNAGITKDSLLMRSREEDWDAVLNVNIKGAMNCTKQVIRGMMKRQWGRIINISSVVGQIGNSGQAIYSTTKAGLLGFTKTMARELASRNITVNAIAPGYIKTEMTDSLPQDVKDSFLARIPLKRMGEPKDIAFAAAFLCLDDASYITGQVLGVNGGMSMNLHERLRLSQWPCGFIVDPNGIVVGRDICSQDIYESVRLVLLK